MRNINYKAKKRCAFVLFLVFTDFRKKTNYNVLFS